jgi:hypothetical protein
VAQSDLFPVGRTTLDFCVTRFIFELQRKFPNRFCYRPKALKNAVISLIQRGMPAFPRPGGRPRDARITRAVALLKAQQSELEQGKRSKIDWHEIALECAPNFKTVRTPHRRREITRLRNSVYARINRNHTNKFDPVSLA